MRGKQDHSRERALRRNQTEAERHLWQSLRERRLLSCRFRRQHRIGPYFADFACPEHRLVVELDGSQHLVFAEADVRRTRVLGALGYRVVRFWNDDVLVRTEVVLEAIAAALRLPAAGPSPCVAAQRCPSPRKRGEG
ncbi:endonuclease domain-containing protein [Lysobacter tyrosinilyticus]